MMEFWNIVDGIICVTGFAIGVSITYYMKRVWLKFLEAESKENADPANPGGNADVKKKQQAPTQSIPDYIDKIKQRTQRKKMDEVAKELNSVEKDVEYTTMVRDRSIAPFSTGKVDNPNAFAQLASDVPSKSAAPAHTPFMGVLRHKNDLGKMKELEEKKRTLEAEEELCHLYLELIEIRKKARLEEESNNNMQTDDHDDSLKSEETMDDYLQMDQRLEPEENVDDGLKLKSQERVKLDYNTEMEVKKWETCDELKMAEDDKSMKIEIDNGLEMCEEVMEEGLQLNEQLNELNTKIEKNTKTDEEFDYEAALKEHLEYEKVQKSVAHLKLEDKVEIHNSDLNSIDEVKPVEELNLGEATKLEGKCLTIEEQKLQHKLKVEREMEECKTQ